MLSWWRERRARKHRRYAEQAAVDRETQADRQANELNRLQERERLHQQAP